MTKLAFHCDQGPRENLEDAAFAMKVNVAPSSLDEVPIFGVMDGVGGHAFGEVASGLGGTHLSGALASAWSPFPLHADPEMFDHRIVAQTLVESLTSANRTITESARQHPDLAGMATTVVCGTVVQDTLIVAWAGDSRCYLYTDGRLLRITRDHSQVAELIELGLLEEEQARSHPAAHAITRYLGQGDDFLPESASHPIRSGDVVLLCTDGLTDVVSDREIADWTGRFLRNEFHFEDLPRQLVQYALDAGTRDNVSVLCCQYAPSCHGNPFRQTLTGAYSFELARTLQRNVQEDCHV